MAEAFARVGDIDICYETFGDPGDPAMLLIMGLGTQMVAYHDAFCAQLAERGFFVIRHDNRDIGRSTRMDDLPVPSLKQLALRSKSAAAYTLSDMARDSVGVLDALGIERAHVVGASMGGMIAQRVAIEHPERTLSLVSIMSNSGDWWHGQPALTMYAVLLRPAP
jgi:pimeloyl-ACP methyl ester carboxylesterase